MLWDSVFLARGCIIHSVDQSERMTAVCEIFNLLHFQSTGQGGGAWPSGKFATDCNSIQIGFKFICWMHSFWKKTSDSHYPHKEACFSSTHHVIQTVLYCNVVLHTVDDTVVCIESRAKNSCCMKSIVCENFRLGYWLLESPHLRLHRQLQLKPKCSTLLCASISKRDIMIYHHFITHLSTLFC